MFDRCSYSKGWIEYGISTTLREMPALMNKNCAYEVARELKHYCVYLDYWDFLRYPDGGVCKSLVQRLKPATKQQT